MDETPISDILQQYCKTRSGELRDRLLTAYLPLVKYVVGRVGVTLPQHVDRADLISIGILGLIDALSRFDPGKETKFETYAVTRIRGEIIDYLRSIDWVPRSIRSRISALEHCYEELLVQTGQRADEKTICERLNLSSDEYARLMEYYTSLSLLSLNQVIDPGSSSPGSELGDMIEDPRSRSPRNSAQHHEMREILTHAIDELSNSERLAVVLYYYQELMLKEIGQVLKVSESRVSQILATALIHLKTKLKKFKELRPGDDK